MQWHGFALNRAIFTGNTGIVEKILKRKDVDVNQKTLNGLTPVQFAERYCPSEKAHSMKAVLQAHNADVPLKNNRNPLSLIYCK